MTLHAIALYERYPVRARERFGTFLCFDGGKRLTMYPPSKEGIMQAAKAARDVSARLVPMRIELSNPPAFLLTYAEKMIARGEASPVFKEASK